MSFAGPPHSTFTGPLTAVSNPRSPKFSGAVTSIIVRSGIFVIVAVRYACAGFTVGSVVEPVTGAFAPTACAVLFAVDTPAFTVGDSAGASAGTSPSQFEMPAEAPAESPTVKAGVST